MDILQKKVPKPIIDLDFTYLKSMSTYIIRITVYFLCKEGDAHFPAVWFKHENFCQNDRVLVRQLLVCMTFILYIFNLSDPRCPFFGAHFLF